MMSISRASRIPKMFLSRASRIPKMFLFPLLLKILTENLTQKKRSPSQLLTQVMPQLFRRTLKVTFLTLLAKTPALSPGLNICIKSSLNVAILLPVSGLPVTGKKIVPSAMLSSRTAIIAKKEMD